MKLITAKTFKWHWNEDGEKMINEWLDSLSREIEIVNLTQSNSPSTYVHLTIFYRHK